MVRNNKSASELEKDVRKALRDVAKSAKSRLATPASTWTDKPDFRIESIDSGGDIADRVVTDDDKYFWLDEGTSKRYAHFPKHFRAKTKVGSFSASAGVPAKPFVSTKIPAARGIDARGWTQMAQLEYGPVLQAAIDRILGHNAKDIFALTKKYNKYVVDE